MRLDLRFGLAFMLCVTTASSVFAQGADLVLRGGHVITVDNDWGLAQAIAVRDGRFVAVGPNAAIAGLVGPPHR